MVAIDVDSISDIPLEHEHKDDTYWQNESHERPYISSSDTTSGTSKIEEETKEAHHRRCQFITTQSLQWSLAGATQGSRMCQARSANGASFNQDNIEVQF